MFLKGASVPADGSNNSVCVLQTMPTDMRALQDFEEEDKLQIQMNDVITIIEGRLVNDGRTETFHFFTSLFQSNSIIESSKITELLNVM